MLARVSRITLNKFSLLLFVFLTISGVKAQHTGHESGTENPPQTVHHEAENHSEAHSADKFNAGEMILDHIGDAHDIHLVGSLHIPLPIILYSSTKGLQIFSSSHFEGHGKVKHYAQEGYTMNGNEITSDDGTSLIDLSITKNAVSLIVSVILLIIIFLSVAKSYTRRQGKAPKGLQSALEPFILFIRDDVAKASIGEKKYMKYLPLLLTFFFFIWINNMMGLIPIFPGGTNVTGNIAITLTLALITFIVVTISGNKHYWHHILAMPGVPSWVLVLLTPIEILGVFLRPFVLMVRLFANITAGHIIALSFFSLIFIFAEMNAGLGWGVSLFTLAFTVFMFFLELLVAFLQAYVFTLLSAIYIGAAVEEPHHDHH